MRIYASGQVIRAAQVSGFGAELAGQSSVVSEKAI
jgi:hypothetical protein